MRLKEIFSRSNKETNVATSEKTINCHKYGIICDTPELEGLIEKWTRNERWKFKNFADFLELIGLKTPVKLSELDEMSNSFKCVTALNEELIITLWFGDGWEKCSEIHVTEGDGTKIYITNNGNESEPKVTLRGRDVKRNGKELKSFYCQYFCNRRLKVDKTHMLMVEIDEPRKYEEKPEIKVLQNCEKTEDYLLGLDNSLVVSDVYDMMMQLLGFSDENISDSEKIMISYIETVNEERRTLSKILLSKGKMQEYAIFENGETFHVFEDGTWKYISGGIRIFYLEEKKNYVFSITGDKECITNVNQSEIMNRVCKRISELWKFVK